MDWGHPGSKYDVGFPDPCKTQFNDSIAGNIEFVGTSPATTTVRDSHTMVAIAVVTAVVTVDKERTTTLE